MDLTSIVRFIGPAFRKGLKFFDNRRYRGQITTVLRNEITYNFNTASVEVKDELLKRVKDSEFVDQLCRAVTPGDFETLCADLRNYLADGFRSQLEDLAQKLYHEYLLRRATPTERALAEEGHRTRARHEVFDEQLRSLSQNFTDKFEQFRNLPTLVGSPRAQEVPVGLPEVRGVEALSDGTFRLINGASASLTLTLATSRADELRQFIKQPLGTFSLLLNDVEVKLLLEEAGQPPRQVSEGVIVLAHPPQVSHDLLLLRLEDESLPLLVQVTRRFVERDVTLDVVSENSGLQFALKLDFSADKQAEVSYNLHFDSKQTPTRRDLPLLKLFMMLADTALGTAPLEWLDARTEEVIFEFAPQEFDANRLERIGSTAHYAWSWTEASRVLERTGVIQVHLPFPAVTGADSLKFVRLFDNIMRAGTPHPLEITILLPSEQVSDALNLVPELALGVVRPVFFEGSVLFRECLLFPEDAEVNDVGESVSMPGCHDLKVRSEQVIRQYIPLELAENGLEMTEEEKASTRVITYPRAALMNPLEAVEG